MSIDHIWLQFLLAALATWRVTHLLALEDGPWDIVVRVRMKLGNGFLGKLMDCFYCLSLWVAAPAALWITRRPSQWPLVWLALSGAACLLERATEKPAMIQPFHEGEGDREDGLLRKSTSTN